ncbi:GNAT family N-acetyltransferase [Nocardioides KLBMP 9356]|uniref:GNAT family N-acetyltransferase n=1 Tax=Nocardioides potassii TaxID=2911371 RepID=A0ABS9H8T8_9ACTN|nr:GNAT family N-acetyltransferase [Nocardioides potassii]MCF6377636.1 GNAT family N-acetyltransferase [Nocardioides potassii]
MSEQAFEMRDVEPGDVDAVLAVIRAAFGAGGSTHGDQVALLWAEVRQGAHLLAERVAVVEGEVVGHVGVSHCWLDARRELVSLAMLSPLSTRPGWERRGIGTALVAAAIEAARSSGRPALVLEGSTMFYGARGFAPAVAHGIEPPSVRVPAPALQVVPFRLEDWMTGRIVYPDVWWRHDCAGLRDPDLAAVEEALGLA